MPLSSKARVAPSSKSTDPVSAPNPVMMATFLESLPAQSSDARSARSAAIWSQLGPMKASLWALDPRLSTIT